jgi:hypothetical protein
MEHVSYAVFDDDERARAAVETIKATGDPRHRCGVVLQRDRLDVGQLSSLENGAAEGLRAGAAIGALLGAIAAAFALGSVGIGAIGGGVALGTMFGGIAGAIGGSGAPDRMLSKLSKGLAAGKILVVVEAPDFASRDRADAVLAANGGSVQHKPLF